MASNVLGIEIGGTKLQFGVSDGCHRQWLAYERYAVDRRRGATGILETIKDVGQRLVKDYRVERVGIGFGGPVQRGVVIRSHQVDGWDNFPLAAWVHEHVGCSAVVGNDCDVAALAEWHWGAGHGKTIVFYVTVGTGVGGGLVVGGRPYGSGRPAVAEIGHLRPVTPSPYASDEELRMTVESCASGLGIVETLLRLARQEPTVFQRQALQRFDAREWDASARVILERLAAGSDPHRWITARDVGQWAQHGNVVARAALDCAVETLGWAIAQTITLVAPQVVVVGGGVSLLGEECFFQPLRCAIDRYVFPPLRETYTVEPARLGEEVVVLGAVLLAAHESSFSWLS